MGDIIEQLAKAKLNFKPILKDASNPHFKSKYVTLDALIGATEVALAEQGLIVFFTDVSDTLDTVRIRATLACAGVLPELWILSHSAMPAKGVQSSAIHSQGSAYTYAKRHAYAMLLGLSADVDDDGNAALPVQQEARPVPLPTPKPAPLAKPIKPSPAAVGARSACEHVWQDKLPFKDGILRYAVGGDKSVNMDNMTVEQWAVAKAFPQTATIDQLITIWSSALKRKGDTLESTRNYHQQSLSLEEGFKYEELPRETMFKGIMLAATDTVTEEEN